MKLSIKAGSTSQTINVFIQDSSSTTGAGLSGLVYNTSSLVAYYALPKAASVQITLATLAAVTTAWTSGGFKEIDATNMKGWYRLDLPDAALASGRFVSLHLSGAANMAPCPVEIELTATDNQSTTAAADALLLRDWTAVNTSGMAARSTLNALRFLRNKWSISGSTLTVTAEDDTTSAWTAAITATAGANPITASDPA